jgi:hypothetical protein
MSPENKRTVMAAAGFDSLKYGVDAAVLVRQVLPPRPEASLNLFK